MDAQKLIDNFSTHLKNVIARAISLASHYNSKQVEPIHLFLALSEEQGCVAGEILKKFGITPEFIKNISSLDIQTLNQSSKTTGPENLPELSPTSRKVLEKGLVLAHDQEHTYVGTEHLLFGLVHAQNKDITEVFVSLNIEYEHIKDQLDTSFQNTTRFSQMGDVSEVFDNLGDMPAPGSMPPPPSSMPMPPHMKGNKKINATTQFTTNLTSKQSQQKIDPVVGRDEEIERIINILARRTKNNPILVGEPGVGKTAIVEGLAKKIASGDVPDVLKRKKILSLDLTLLVAGTIYRGEFEARLKQIVDECSANPNYILFIDELHNIIGAGSNQGTMDAANILKPALARGQLRCIGATTYDEYKKYITSDPALERRFQMIDVEEPNDKETLTILQGIKKYYESFHHVSITENALKEALRLSNKYIHDNFQPDKTIDLIDEAASSVKTSRKTSEHTTRLFALEQKQEEYIEEKDKAISQERLKDALELKKKIEKLDTQITDLSKTTQNKTKKKLRVTEQHVRSVLSKKMHIDETILSQNEWENLKTLEKRLSKHIVGQKQTIQEVIASLKRAELGIQNQNKPFGSFLFVGPSGVGKTELTKRLAEELYHDKQALIKLDMGEFSESHSVSKILGSPAGYIGYKDRNPFIEKLKKRPYCVLLFDEIDKAHPDVSKLLLQILDEGEISDSNGRKISLKHTTIILTTNVGNELFKSQGIGFDNETHENRDVDTNFTKNIHNKLKETLGNALLSRLGTICVFNTLGKKDIEKIIKQHIDRVSKHFKKTQKFSITADASALKSITKETSNIDLGARNIEKKVQELLHELAVETLQDKTKKEAYKLSYRDNTYSLN
ncbi:hypothetical protein C0581_04945 [Candidatus Parcubacteria bacterium]|nr:MAG: hypothetical protein C0581_04945 [Candidatus Parcubacteria bacterium]